LNLILSRHGNTFNPGDKIIWVGASNDLPLTGKGREQAKNLAVFLRSKKISPAVIYCGPLKRTREYAAIVIKEMGLKIEPIIDQRLNELDYGKWSGLSSEEIIQEYGKTDLENWDKYSIWPPKGVWATTEDQVLQDVTSFIDDISKQYGENALDTVLVISSNGKIRYFLSLVDNSFDKGKKMGDFKVKTGNMCKLTFLKGKITIDYWNKNPLDMHAVKKFIFGPVPSRRLGVSLGIDLNAYKTCNLDCVYCECGRTTALTNEIQSCYSVDDIMKELQDAVSKLERLDYITFSGSGEPTLFKDLGTLIDRIKAKYPDKKLAMLTNATLFTNSDVAKAVAKCDLVLPSVDSVTRDGFEKINRPHSGLRLQEILNALKNFRKTYKGLFWVEVFIVPGINDNEKELVPLVRFLKDLAPDKVQLNSLDRPGTEPWVRPFTKEELQSKILPYFSGLDVEVVARNIPDNNTARYAKSN
jgi:wyosine [tRNA(Phe)-imidazoG37] synthetase (radical SAM superfamily)/broad specificity phosphatase PhoE